MTIKVDYYKGATSDAKPMGRIDTWLMKRRGVHDGKMGFPRKDETGQWSSPLIRKECDAYNEFTVHEWLACERNTAELFVKYKTIEARKEGFSRQIQTLSAPNKGEAEKYIEHANHLLTVIKAQITEFENITRLRCQRGQYHVQVCLAVYWQGVMQSHTDVANLNISSSTTELPSPGEATYMNEHRFAKEDIMNSKEEIKCQTSLRPALKASQRT